MDNQSPQLIACHDCDLLQQEIPLKPGCSASCSRCGAILYRNATDSINRTLAYTLAASVLFVIANIFPIFAIEVQGGGSEINLSGAVRYLWNQQMKSVSLLVVLTTILIPALELVTMSYLLLALKLRRIPAGYPILLRMINIVGPWGMIEVFMLGILVSLVKLTSSFKVIPGVALWSFGVLTFLYAATSASFSARDVWAHLGKKPGVETAA
ncbi:MAG: paraquat-inducible protein A [Desulfuromonadaceae bacterium]|nr:paraquat-inducible protein A [Desulfuromonadaceae bacterium]MDD2846983.1 paraquat-inducible protein A [Desulfuromonadaceae bacterium]MDD4129039.1 paraquat-inducible protein A [Desulfuromonadaceae bacterium]